MEIQTKYFGKVTITEEQQFQFPAGLPGFVEEKDFALVAFPGNEAFQLLQSMNDVNLAFVITDPYYYYTDYAVDLDEALQEAIEIEDRKEIVIMAIVTIQDPFKESTMNLQAPLIFNVGKRLAKQYILQNSTYASKTPLLQQEQGARKRDA